MKREGRNKIPTKEGKLTSSNGKSKPVAWEESLQGSQSNSKKARVTIVLKRDLRQEREGQVSESILGPPPGKNLPQRRGSA